MRNIRVIVAVGLIAAVLGAVAGQSVHPQNTVCSGAVTMAGWDIAVERASYFDNGAVLKCAYNRNAAVGDGTFACAAPYSDPQGNAWALTFSGIDANGRGVCQYVYSTPAVTGFRTAR